MAEFVVQSVFAFAFALPGTLTLCWLYLWLATSRGWVRPASTRDLHTRPTVSGGGIGAALAILAALLVLPNLGVNFPGQMATLILVAVFTVVGFFDDHFPLPTATKLALQAVGIGLFWLLQPGGIPLPDLTDLSGLSLVPVLALIAVGTALAVIGGLQYLFFRTALGRDFRAVSDDPEIAQLMGINRRHVFALSMGVAMVVVAIAGVMFGVAGSFDPYLGPSRLLSAFEAVIIGGVGSLWGTLAGGIVLGISEQFGSRAFGEEFKQISGHVAFLIILLLRPRGLFPRDKD